MFYDHGIPRPQFIQPSMTPLKAAKQIATDLKRDIELLVDMGADTTNLENILEQVAERIARFGTFGFHRATYRVELGTASGWARDQGGC